MKHKGWLIFGITVAAISGIAVWGYFQYQKIMDYCWNIRSYVIKKLSPTQITFDLKISVKNKSAIPIKITNYSFDVYMSGIFVTKVSDPIDKNTGKPQVQPLGANQLSDFNITIDFAPKDVLKAAFSLDTIGGIITDFNDVKFSMKGWISVNGITNVKLPDIDFTLKDVMPNGQPSSPCE